MDMLTFAFELARLGIDNVVIEYACWEPGLLYRKTTLHRCCAAHASRFKYGHSTSIEETLQDARAHGWKVIRVVVPETEHDACERCILLQRSLATAHPAPWKQHDGEPT